MAAAAIMNCYLVTLDHPQTLLPSRKSVFYYFQSLKIFKFGLKRLFPSQKFTFWGDFDPETLFFVIETPKRHILGRIRVV